MEAGQPSDSISSVVADGVSPPVREVACAGNKSQAETPEPKVSLGIPRKTHSPKRLPWAPEHFTQLPASVPAKHLCPPEEPVELPNFMDAAPAAAKAAAVSAAAPHPARAAAPHAVAESPADQEFRPDDYWDDGRKVNHQDWNTSAVADGNENSDLAQKEKKRYKNRKHRKSRATRSRLKHAQQWCEYCKKASHDTWQCRCLLKVRTDSKEISWAEFLERPDL